MPIKEIKSALPGDSTRRSLNAPFPHLWIISNTDIHSTFMDRLVMEMPYTFIGCTVYLLLFTAYRTVYTSRSAFLILMRRDVFTQNRWRSSARTSSHGWADQLVWRGFQGVSCFRTSFRTKNRPWQHGGRESHGISTRTNALSEKGSVSLYHLRGLYTLCTTSYVYNTVYRAPFPHAILRATQSGVGDGWGTPVIRKKELESHINI